jgi:hypothetical protein
MCVAGGGSINEFHIVQIINESTCRTIVKEISKT